MIGSFLDRLESNVKKFLWSPHMHAHNRLEAHAASGTHLQFFPIFFSKLNVILITFKLHLITDFHTRKNKRRRSAFTMSASIVSLRMNTSTAMVDRMVNFFVEHEDLRTKSWFLSNSPGPLFMILIAYLYFCLSAGPRYMRDRKPYELKTTLLVYNALQVVFSWILLYEVSHMAMKIFAKKKKKFNKL